MGWDIEEERTQSDSVAPPAARPIEDVSLLVLRGPDAGTRFLVAPPGGVLGRQPGCAMQLADPNISRRHALVEITDGRVMITDLGSKNGVYVNGAQVSRSEVFDGNNVQLSSDTTLRVRFQDPAETSLLDALQSASATDAVTGMANRRYLSHRLPEELSYARRHGEPLALAMLQIDDLDKVLATDGRVGGNAMLAAVADRLRANTRLEDVLVRHDRDGLVVLLRNTTAAQAELLALRLCEVVAAGRYHVGGVELAATLCIGVASYQPDLSEVRDADELLARAERALQLARQDGLGSVRSWQGDGELPAGAP